MNKTIMTVCWVAVAAAPILPGAEWYLTGAYADEPAMILDVAVTADPAK